MTFKAIFFLTTFLAAAAAARGDSPEGDVPVAPIAASEFRGWTNAFRLANGTLEVVVVPAIGRIAFLGYGSDENLLRSDPALHGKLPAGEPGTWANFGGDWFWPVAQSRWPSFQPADWPPSPVLDGHPWQGRAWKSADGAQCCLLSREYGDPLHLKVSRLVKLHKEDPVVRVRQSAERVAPSTIPVTLWNITQISAPDHVVLPIDADSTFPGGVAALKFALPTPEILQRCDKAAVYDTRTGGEHKLGSDSPRAWLAAQKKETLIVERATAGPAAGPYPDGGCTVEMYSNSGLGYTEIETLSVEQDLKPGERIENTLQISCYRLPSPLSGCALADRVRVLLGEKPPPPDRPSPH